MGVAFLPKLALALLAGGLIGRVFSWPSLTLAILCALFFVLALLSYLKQLLDQAFWGMTLLTAVVLGIFLSRQAQELEAGRFAQMFGPVYQLKVRVLSDPYLEKRALVECVDSPNEGRIMAILLDHLSTLPQYRQTILISGVAHGARIVPYHWEPFDGPVPVASPLEQIQYLCLTIRDRIDTALVRARPPPEFLAFARAELFGKRQDLNPETRRVLEENGLTHIIAVSGMHTSLLAAAVFFCLVPLLGREAAGWVTAVVVLGFCVMVGLQPPVLRATICTLLALIGHLNQFPSRVLTFLSAAFVIEFLIFPQDLAHAGFQLSYLSVLALALAARVIKQSRASESPLSGWMQALLPLLLIQVFTAPLTAHLFYRWSWLSILSNLLFLPVFTFLIVWAAAGAAVALVWPALAAWLFWIGDACYGLTIQLLQILPAALNVSSNFGYFPLLFLVVFLAGWVLFLWLAPARPRVWLLGAAGWLILFSAYPSMRDLASGPIFVAGGAQAPFSAIREGRTLPFVRIRMPTGVSPAALGPMIRDWLKSGVRDIIHLDAPANVRARLEKDFRVGTGPPPATAGITVAEDRGFELIRPGIGVIYWTASADPPPCPSPDRSTACWLVLEKSKSTSLIVPASKSAPNLFLTGPAETSEVRAIDLDRASHGAAPCLSAPVDGNLSLHLDGDRAGRYTTTLMESFEE